jgi:hypothetical protein
VWSTPPQYEVWASLHVDEVPAIARVAEAEQGAPSLVRGSMTLRVAAPTSQCLESLAFTLPLNAVSRDDSVLLQKRPADFRWTGPVNATDAGIAIDWIHVEEVGSRPNSLGDPLPMAAANVDGTALEVMLPRPFCPVDSPLSLRLGWNARLPPLQLRTGHTKDFVALVHWFPRLARLEDWGGWATEPPTAFSEFDADLSTITVHLDSPWPCYGARTLLHAKDLALFCSPAGGSAQQSIATADGPLALFAWSPTASLASANLDWGSAAAHALTTWLGPLPGRRLETLPVPDLTLVHPPDHASGSSGMEYPSTVTTGASTDEILGHPDPHLLRVYDSYFSYGHLANVVTHELAHQWFYGSLNNSEQHSPYLDEGFTTWVTGEVLGAMASPAIDIRAASTERPTGLDVLAGVYRAGALQTSSNLSLGSDAPAFHSSVAYFSTVYFRTALWLESLARLYGHSAIRAAVAKYARDNRGKRVDEDTFLRILEEIVDPAAAALWNIGLQQRSLISPRMSLLEGSTENGCRAQLDLGLIPATLPVNLQWYGSGTWSTPLASSLAASGTEAPSPTFSLRAGETLCFDPEHRLLIDNRFDDNCVRCPSSPLRTKEFPPRTYSHATTPAMPNWQIFLGIVLHALGALL